MPITASPSRGYSDWQRVSNWDSGILWSGANVTITGATSPSAPLDVSRFHALGGYVQQGLGQLTLTLNWYADQALTTLVGGRGMTLDNSIIGRNQLRIPHLGPWLQPVFAPVSVNPTASWQLFATNRAHPLESIPSNNILIAKPALTVGAGATVGVPTVNYCSGPARVFVGGAGASDVLSLQVAAGVGTWANLDQITLSSAMIDWNVELPTSAWRLAYTNNGGGSVTVQLVALSTLTGSL